MDGSSLQVPAIIGAGLEVLEGEVVSAGIGVSVFWIVTSKVGVDDMTSGLLQET